MKQKLPKYAKEVIRQGREAAARFPGRAFTVEVRHDDWCALLAGTGPCNCNPEVCRAKLIPSPRDN